MDLLDYTKKTADDYVPLWLREMDADSITLDASDWNEATGEKEGRVVWLSLCPPSEIPDEVVEAGGVEAWLAERTTTLEVERDNPAAFRAARRLLRCLRRAGFVTLTSMPGEWLGVTVRRLGLDHGLCYRRWRAEAEELM